MKSLRIATRMRASVATLAGLTALSCGRVGFEPLRDSKLDAQGNSGGFDAGAVGGNGGAGDGGSGGATSGTGGDANSGSGGSGGSTGSGGAGATASTGGSVSTGGAGGIAGDAGDAGAGCPDCGLPVGIALSNSTLGANVGGPGGNLLANVCPNDEIVVGFSGLGGFDGSATYLQSLAVRCAPLAVSSAAPHAVSWGPSHGLPMRGSNGTQAFQVECPPGNVMVGFDAKTGNYLMELTLLCAPLTITTGSGGHTLSIGAATALPPAGGPDGTVRPRTMCPAGQIVRGNGIRAGLVVDGLSIACATPSLTHATGEACSSATDCETRVCTSGTCRPSTCVASAGCTCASYEGRDYAVCTAARSRAAAVTACAAMGMQLARIDGVIENGWLRHTADQQSLADFWLGGNSLASPNEWRWPDGALFWQGGPSGSGPPATFANWVPYNGEPTAGPSCVRMIPTDQWDTMDCSVPYPYACERY